MGIELLIKIRSKNQLECFETFLQPRFMLQNVDQWNMLNELLSFCIQKVQKSKKKFKKSCTLKFTIGQSSAIKFLFENVYLGNMDYSNPVHTTGMLIKDELVRQSFSINNHYRDLF